MAVDNNSSSAGPEYLNCSYQWTIQNFSTFSTIRTSRLFPEYVQDGLEWSLDIYPKGTKDDSDVVALFLALEQNNNSNYDIPVKFKLGIVNTKGEHLYFYEGQKTFSDDTLWGLHKFIARSDLFNEKYELISNDALTVFCEISAYVGDDISNTPLIESDDYKLLLQNKGLSDVTIVVDEKEFPAHKEILAAHSPVFTAMFQSNMEECKTNRVEIKDIKQNIMEELINYMYNGRVNNLKAIAEEIIVQAAHKYDIEGLQIMCEKSMSERLTFSNAMDFFIFSDIFQLTTLKNHVKKFILTFPAAVGTLPEFKWTVLNHPHLGIELFRALANPEVLNVF